MGGAEAAAGAGTAATLGAEAGTTAGAEAAGTAAAGAGNGFGLGALSGLTSSAVKYLNKLGNQQNTGESDEKSDGNGIAQLGQSLGQLFGSQSAPTKGDYVEPNVQATPQGVSFDWQRRNPFAPTSGRK